MRSTPALLLLAAACSSSSGAPGGALDASAGTDAGNPVDASAPVDGAPPPVDAAGIVAARPYTLHVPIGYDPTKPTPLVVMFHGYSATGALGEAIMRLTPASDAHGFLYAYGDGTIDSAGKHFWNATDACCNIDHSTVDDVAYFDAIVADVASKENVDPKRVYAVGHSNGGFMVHRLACDRAGEVAAIVSLEGATWNDASRCNPVSHVSVAEVHGDADPTILYTGGTDVDNAAYPSAPQTVATWAAKNGCTGTLADTGVTLHLDTSQDAGNETLVAAYGGCPGSMGVELWTVHGGGHIPWLAHPTWGDVVWAFLSAHAKP
jgi:polyhydroxybutyrate depolymerase